PHPGRRQPGGAGVAARGAGRGDSRNAPTPETHAIIPADEPRAVQRNHGAAASLRGPGGADADRIRHAFGAVRMTGARVYWHTARVTKISVGHSASFGARPLNRTCAGHLCSDWVSRLLPVWNPLPRQAAAAAAWQSGAPFCATAQRSRTITMRAFGNPTTASVASLAASRVSLPS